LPRHTREFPIDLRAMNILFIHQDMPGQFAHLAAYLARDTAHRVVFLTKGSKAAPPGVVHARYAPPALTAPDPFVRGFESAVLHGRAVANACLELQDRGFVPDVVLAHPGWGESLYVKDVVPAAKLINYCEFFYHAAGADIGFDPNEQVDGAFAALLRTRNAHLLLSLAGCDRGLSPTNWQRFLHPDEYRHKIEVIFDGIDAERVRPDADAVLRLADGTVLTRSDTVITYVARNLEPHRGFPSFMRAVPQILSALPDAHIVIVGGDGVSYGRAPADGRTWRQVMTEEVRLPPSRAHFAGTLPYDDYVSLLQVSSAHVYLTVPFVLSWSFMEALSAGCIVVGSQTAPVMEVLRDGHNGFLADFFSPADIAAKVIAAVRRRGELEEMRRRARQTILGHYDLATCLPRQVRLLRAVAGYGDEPVVMERCA
jgi:glycosyltransferase involved in cell wall biosynthesis